MSKSKKIRWISNNSIAEPRTPSFYKDINRSPSLRFKITSDVPYHFERAVSSSRPSLALSGRRHLL